MGGGGGNLLRRESVRAVLSSEGGCVLPRVWGSPHAWMGAATFLCESARMGEHETSSERHGVQVPPKRRSRQTLYKIHMRPGDRV